MACLCPCLTTASRRLLPKALAVVLTAYCGCRLFLLQEKIDVNGPKTHPVYQYLKGACSNCSGDVRWNFAGGPRRG